MQIYSKTQIDEIALALKSGKAAVLPTDTVWGVVSLNEGQIYTIKHRPVEKKVSKFVGSVDEIGLPSFYCDVLKEYMPGDLTVIWHEVGYRVPKCDYLLQLLKLTGPLYQSSANISGKQPFQTSQETFKEFKTVLDRIIIVDNAPYEMLTQQPSTIINLDKMVVVRPGEVDGQAIIDKLKERKP